MNEKNIIGLQMIQEIISRMGSNSFNLKGWTVTLVAGIFALASKDSDKLFFLVTYIPIIIFWCLDSYYLQLERKYISLYNKVRIMNGEFDFNMDVSTAHEENTMFLECFISKTEIGFYLPLALITGGIIIIINL